MGGESLAKSDECNLGGDAAPLPPGQLEVHELPRFGLALFAERFPDNPSTIDLALTGDVEQDLRIGAELGALPRVEQVSDLHCVTTWSYRGLRFSGFRFRDFYETIARPGLRPEPSATQVVLRAQDGYCQCLLLEDLLKDDVLLADRLDDAPLSIAHGAPLRLVAPAHYGYKNIKHLRAIEFWRDRRNYRFPSIRLMDHPRARVALEERGLGLPGWLYRRLYKPLVRPVTRSFRVALERHLAEREGARRS